MKKTIVACLVGLLCCSCQIEPSGKSTVKLEAHAAACEVIRANNWSKTDPITGKFINETDDHWDISFPIPDAIQGGKKPDHRIVRVSKKTKQAKELGID